MRDKTKKELDEIKKEIIENWKLNHNYLGIKRNRLNKLSDKKIWKVKKVLRAMRKNKEIYLDRKNYFIDLEKLGLKE
jgi:hypothetical protein